MAALGPFYASKRSYMDYCPICYTELEVRECAPCHDCGWNIPTEIDHWKEHKHTYATYAVYAGFRLNLCNFCLFDFGSYRPEFFGLPAEERFNMNKFEFIRQLHHPQLELDKFCPTCSMRLKFLKFVQAIRETKQAS
jgi:hypothetical protein